MSQILDTKNTIVPARQAWETPRLIELSGQRTESGEPFNVEITINVGGNSIPYGPTTPGS